MFLRWLLGGEGSCKPVDGSASQDFIKLLHVLASTEQVSPKKEKIVKSSGWML
jgi:hypothetical protein